MKATNSCELLVTTKEPDISHDKVKEALLAGGISSEDIEATSWSNPIGCARKDSAIISSCNTNILEHCKEILANDTDFAGAVRRMEVGNPYVSEKSRWVYLNKECTVTERITIENAIRAAFEDVEINLHQP